MSEKETDPMLLAVGGLQQAVETLNETVKPMGEAIIEHGKILAAHEARFEQQDRAKTLWASLFSGVLVFIIDHLHVFH